MEITAQGLFTEEQIKYVDSIKDEDLRSHLLHQVRLRDLMEQDRDAFEKESNNKNSVEHAIKVLKNALKTNDGYREGWKSNIAMAFKDEYSRSKLKYKTREDIHYIANEAADNFLTLLCS
jgi:hypothetical protein